ncbi:MAG: cell division protein FtsQ/DivIB [Candidatus Omnitrophota bacterium]|jgi:cell division septal protein FtsQ
MKRKKIRLPAKPALLTAVIFIAAVIIIRYIVITLKRSDYFRIKEVVLKNQEEGFDSSRFLGRSIFDLDLEKESGRVTQLYPVYKDIRLFRVLPDRLVIVFNERKPLACVKLYKYFYVDRDGVLFGPGKGEEFRVLPVIRGLENRIRGPEPGRRYNIKELTGALDIIKQIGEDPLLARSRIERIDVSDPVNILCLIRVSDADVETGASGPPALEVRLSNNGIAEQVRILSGLFAQLNKEMGNIKYVDLRFKEPVVRFKNVK